MMGHLQMIKRKGDIVPVYQKDLKSMLINYRLIILLPIFAKIFQKTSFTSIFEYFIKNELFTVSWSCFFPGVLLDISTAFENVRHKALVYKLKPYRISAVFLKITDNYLTDRKQRVVFNSQTSSQESVPSGLPSGSICRELLS